MFVGRTAELAALERFWASGKAEFFILYGRRRVGKTALLRHFCANKKHVYFLAAQLKEEDNLKHFQEALQIHLNDPLIANFKLSSWEDAFTYLAQSQERLIVVLDEFQYLCEANPALPSLLQRFWDLQGAQSKLFLVLCGSYISFMERAILSEKSPLFGRRTGQQKLKPLPYFEAAAFFPTYGASEQMAVYGILGGTPAYLQQFDPQQDLKTNIIRQILSQEAYLYDEVNLLLRMELNEICVYATILKAIASGATKLNEIATRTGLNSPTANKYLQVLRDLGLVERQVSVFARAKNRKGRYYISDPYIRFWFRFVMPHSSLIEIGQGEVVYERFIEPNFSTYMGSVFEDICCQALRYQGASLVGEYVQTIGKHWDRDFDLDLVAILADGTYLIGECKWNTQPIGLGVLAKLTEKVAKIELGQQTRLALFSLAGFTPELQEVASKRGVVLLSGSQIIFK